jgi:hypothetical protein
MATANGYSSSAVATAAYTMILPAAIPIFSVAPGTYSATQIVSISDTTPGAAIYYTTNGSTPTTSSTAYSGPITISLSETVRAIATAPGYSTSATGAAAYTITTASPCDVNNDGTTNSSDVQKIINEALGLAPAVNDLNGDGVVNIIDVQIVINAALGLGCRSS